MIELLIILGTGALLIFLTALVVSPFLFVEYLDFRRSVWIAVSPAVTPVVESQLPPAFTAFFGAVRPVLEEAGFHVATIAQAPAFGAGMAWWHALLLNRATGERAAVTCLTDERTHPEFDVTLAFECDDGRHAASILAEVVPSTVYLRWADFGVAANYVRALIALQHDRMKSIGTSGECTAVMPAEGREFEWAKSRVAIVTARMAEGRFERDTSGTVYRPTRRHAIRLVIRNFRFTRPPRQRRLPRGFPVLPVAEQ